MFYQFFLLQYSFEPVKLCQLLGCEENLKMRRRWKKIKNRYTVLHFILHFIDLSFLPLCLKSFSFFAIWFFHCSLRFLLLTSWSFCILVRLNHSNLCESIRWLFENHWLTLICGVCQVKKIFLFIYSIFFFCHFHNVFCFSYIFLSFSKVFFFLNHY